MTEDRRITKTKAAIREAFFSIIKEKDAPKVTVTEIAKRANIDRKTFYLHYDSTDAIMVEFYQDLINEFLLILEKNDFFDRFFDVSSLFQSLNLLIDQNIELYRHIAKMPSYFSFLEDIKNIIKIAGILIYTRYFSENLLHKANYNPIASTVHFISSDYQPIFPL